MGFCVTGTVGFCVEGGVGLDWVAVCVAPDTETEGTTVSEGLSVPFVTAWDSDGISVMSAKNSVTDPPVIFADVLISGVIPSSI